MYDFKKLYSKYSYASERKVITLLAIKVLTQPVKDHIQPNIRFDVIFIWTLFNCRTYEFNTSLGIFTYDYLA